MHSSNKYQIKNKKLDDWISYNFVIFIRKLQNCMKLQEEAVLQSTEIVCFTVCLERF